MNEPLAQLACRAVAIQSPYRTRTSSDRQKAFFEGKWRALNPRFFPQGVTQAVEFGMRFANCQQCGRVFHFLDPNMPAPQDDYWPKLGLGDAAFELCPGCLNMTRDDAQNPESTENAAHIAGLSAGGVPGAATDLEATWEEWLSHVPKVDRRELTLLKAAFDAGYEAGRVSQVRPPNLSAETDI